MYPSFSNETGNNLSKYSMAVHDLSDNVDITD